MKDDAMQAVSEPMIAHERTTSGVWRVSLETIALMILVTFALVLRLAELDAVPMSPLEAERAVATVELFTPSASSGLPDSPLVFWMQTLGFQFAGVSEFTARIGGVIAGILLILTPQLLRAEIGATRAFVLSVLLALSPLTFIAAREQSPAIWSVLLGAVGLAGMWRFYVHQRPVDALMTTAALGAMVLLSGASGVLLGVILLVSLILGGWWVILRAPQDYGVPGNDIISQTRAVIGRIPQVTTLGLLVLLVISVATGFMLYPGGLALVSESLVSALRGVITPAVPLAPFAWPLLTVLLYDLGLIVFAIIGVIMLWRREHIPAVDRIMAAWMIVGVLVLLVYRGATPADALLLILPLMWFASAVIVRLFVDHVPDVIWSADLLDDDAALSVRFRWVKWALGAITLGLLLVISLHVQEIARTLLLLPPGALFGDLLARMTDPAMARLPYSLTWLIVTVLFTFVGATLTINLWGTRNTIQGLGLGLLFFALGASMGGGWNVAVSRAAQPNELWYTVTTSPDAYLLRETLTDIAKRDAGGFLTMPVHVVQTDGTATDIALMRWLLRDLENVRYVGSAEQARGEQIVIMPPTEDAPELGGAYVGQSFVMERQWARDITFESALAYTALRRVRMGQVVDYRVVLWLRQDVYDGIPTEERPSR